MRQLKKRVRRFCELSSEESQVLFRALIVVAATRISLWVFPFSAAQRIATRIAGRERYSVQRLVWAVTVASGYLPRATCLTQALAIQALLARSGHESRLQIGIAKDASRKFEAHAWVICENQIVIGGHDVARYTPLAAWEA